MLKLIVMMIKMSSLFKDFYDVVRYTLQRFPTAFISTLVFAFLMIRHIWKGGSMSNGVISFSYSACWVFAFSVMVQLIFELVFTYKKLPYARIIELVAQGIILVVFLSVGYFVVKNGGDERFHLHYFGAIIAFLLVILQLLSKLQSQDIVIPNCIVSWFVSLIIASIVFLGIGLIYFSIELLLFGNKQNDDMISSILTICYTVLFPFLFLSYSTQKTKIVIPKVFKIIQCYVLFPVYLILVGVLFCYLFKVIIIRKVPVGQFNYFISTATVLFLFFYLTLQNYKNRAIEFFYKFGSLFMLVLILFQGYFYSIRVHAYGFTALRYASLLYIIFSIIFTILPFVKKGRYMNYLYVVFAIFVLFATFTPFNILDVPVWSQNRRVVSILKKHNLTISPMGIMPTITGSDLFSSDEKLQIADACSYMRECSGKLPDWFKPIKSDEVSFYSVFGFSESELRAKYFSKNITIERNDFSLDVANFKEIHFMRISKSFSNENSLLEQGVFSISTKSTTYDITKEIILFIEENNHSNTVVKKDAYIFSGNGAQFVIPYFYYYKNVYSNDKYMEHINFDLYVLE